MLEAELLAHLDGQIGSAQKLLRLVLTQGEAIRARDVEGVLARLADIQTEMGRRARLEEERVRVLQGAGSLLGVPAPGHARAPVPARHAEARPRRASARPSCAGCWPRSPASTASTAR